ncbi:ABC transporter substrate-binding protein [Clostridium autoethanogenum]|uniref:ABC transporter substrate-binding protein n=1 Tax=Clostridium autoethanogenum DSM 10061 TaxID=1341692 RepID=A0ABM5NZU4_9CLOT|nr:ABC transporter substrate-binding protein [Clostridium autoethanogenum]AGY78141.1 ABC transporter substrate-binding protein [Clostridium autoethanogenum DSM 10061]ALU38274.1 ABC-type nitrate/sulfonate/bicarbonate transporter periplasmic subunit family 3 [Clostridium autoethanogenum DSM 10061]OVY51037.1 putative aliphatic sulfonates-binding protein precursor [Clostridium autoethanogenum]
MKRKLLSVIFAGIFIFTLTACSKGGVSSSNSTNDSEKKVVRIGYPGSQYSLGGAAAIAQQKKFFEEQLKKIGYTVEYNPFSGQGPAVNEALTSNKIDIAVYADFPGVVLKSKGVQTDLIGISQNKIYSTIVVQNNSKIKTVEDLKGKKIGFAKGTYAQKFLLEILSKSGLSDKDVQLVNVTTDAESSLISGNLDALVLTDDSALQLTAVKKVARNIVSSRQYPEMSAQSIVVARDSYIKQNSKVPVAIDKALIEARNYFKSNPEESYKLLTKAGLSLEAVKQQYSGESPNFNVLQTEINQDTIKRLDETQKFLLDHNLITNKFNTVSWADKSYYQEAIK